MGFADHSLCDGFVCYWRIQKYNIYKPSLSNILKSHTFRSTVLSNSKWHLEICQKSSGSLSMHLILEEGDNINVNYSFYMLTNKSWISAVENKNQKFNVGSKETKAEALIQLQKRKVERWEYLIDDTLIISVLMSKVGMVTMSAQCLIQSEMISEKEISHYKCIRFHTLKPSDWLYFTNPDILNMTNGRIADEERTKEIEKKKSNEDIENFFYLFKENKVSFVTLQTTNRDFTVLKTVLCAQSPVFCTMFKTGINTVKVNEIDNNTLFALLNFLHGGVLKDLKWDEITKLYHAANRYKIALLKNKCVSLLKDDISNETVCKAFVLSKLYQIEDLYICAERYFCDNSKTILLSNEWKTFLFRETQLAAEILHKTADNLSIKNNK